MILISSHSISASDLPRVVSAYAAGPVELRVVYDRQAAPAALAGLAGTRIVFGDGVKAGDRFVESKPGERPSDEARGSLRIAAAKLMDEGRTLVLATDPHSRDTSYALSLPPSLGGDLVYRLRGVEVTWDDGKDDAPPGWSGWWPTLDRGADATGQAPPMKAGRLTVKSLVALPKGKTTFSVRASAPFELNLGNETAKSTPDQKEGHRAEVTAEIDGSIDLLLMFMIDGKLPVIAAEVGGRPIPADRLLLPWVPPASQNAPETPAPAWALSGGDPSKGAAVFKGQAAKCAICHKVRGEGGDVGPDLSSLVHRDRAWVYRQINEPSVVIHPDYLPYTVVTKDGRVLVGIVRAEGADSLKVVDAEAKATTLLKAEIDALKPSATSIMPVGLLGPLGEEGVKDLLAFLTGK